MNSFQLSLVDPALPTSCTFCLISKFAIQRKGILQESFLVSTTCNVDQLPNLLPQLWWEGTECRIHPCGIQSKSHWRLSLSTAASATPGKRMFFNPSNGYLYNGYSELRIGPGNDK